LNPTQTTDLLPPITTYVDAVEGVLDRHAMVMQQLQYDVGRAIKSPVGCNLNSEQIVSEVLAAAHSAAEAEVNAQNSASAAAASELNAAQAVADAGTAASAAQASAATAITAEGNAIAANTASQAAASNAQSSATAAAASASDVQAVIANGGLIPSGAIMAFAMATAPSGWVECDGAAVSRDDYADLYAAIGDSYGAGDGSTTFNLPDLRGEFLRGWDNGRGVDAEREMGSAQGDEIKSHTHGYYRYGDTQLGGGGWGGSPNQTEQTTATGGSETRPRNVAVMYCIKA